MDTIGAETDLLLRIRGRVSDDEGYPVEALLADGSFFRGELHLDLVDLQAADNEHDVSAYGRLLYESLFTGWISHAFELARSMARVKSDGHTRLRLWLDGDDAALQAIKWERLHHNYNDQFLPVGVTEATAFSRYTGLGAAEPQPISERPIRVLVAISNPKELRAENGNLAPLDVAGELSSLLSALSPLLERRQMRLTLLAGQSSTEQLPDALRQELGSLHCTLLDGATTLDRIAGLLADAHVFHFLGHGRYSSRLDATALLLENDDGNGDWVDAAALISTLASGVQLPHLIFLASCETARRDAAHPYVGLAAQLVQAGVPAVVAMQETITLPGARQLAAEFYGQLLQHGVVDRALNAARSRLYNDEPGEGGDWSTPVLFMRLRTGRLFIADPVLGAMRAMAAHPTFSFFDAHGGRYIPLPIEVVDFTDPLQLRRLDRLDPESTGTIDVQQAVRARLEEKNSGASEKPTFIGLVGGAGSNKKTQLQKLAWDCLQQALAPQNGREVRLPLYIDLRQHQSQRSGAHGYLESCALESLSRFWPDLEAKSLADIPSRPRLILLFYGIDLISAEENAYIQQQLLSLMQTYPQFDYIVAAGENAVSWIDFQPHADMHLLVMQPLRRVKVRHFLENLEKVPNVPIVPTLERAILGEDLLMQLYQSQLFDLVATPWFMVQLLLRAARGDFPLSRTDALQKLTEDAIARLPAQEGIRSHAGPTLYRLAWDMQRSRCCELPVQTVFQTMTEIRSHRGYNLEQLFKGLVDNELLYTTGDGHIGFSYEPFRAYCCAKAIVGDPDGEMILEGVTSTLSTPTSLRWWEDTLVLLTGLLAQDKEQKTLTWLLRRLVEGHDLLHGEQLFLAARCLMECAPGGEATSLEIESLRQHVIRALYWRTDSKNEPLLRLRVLATQLLSRVAEPDAIIHLARLVYEKVRTNLSDEIDYEFSTVRMASAIGLRRIGQPQEVNDILSKQFHPSLKVVFQAWREGDLETLEERYCDAENAGVQAMAVLAIGDLAEQLWTVPGREEGPRALRFLSREFTAPQTPQSVRWAVADSLAMIDARAVAREVITPYLDDLETRDGEAGRDWSALDKSLAYLVGLVRMPGPRALSFLVDHCIGGSRDMRLWLCAMQALARVGGPEARGVLANIAQNEERLRTAIDNIGDRCHLRREAINLLVEVGDREAIADLRRSPAVQDPALMPAIFRATRQAYWQE